MALKIFGKKFICVLKSAYGFISKPLICVATSEALTIGMFKKTLALSNLDFLLKVSFKFISLPVIELS